MIIAVVSFELFGCLFLALLIGFGGGSEAAIPLNVWLLLAIMQLTIHYLPRGRITRYGLCLILAMMLIAGVTPGKIEALPYFHQALFIAGVGALPQFWWQWFSKDTAGRAALFALVSLPFGYAVWIVANIWIVKVEAWMVADGQPYCILASDGRILAGGRYHQVPNAWALSGWRMFSGRGGGGSGNCCQWDFHALLVTHDQRLFNWSYESQRFESVSARTERLMSLSRISCP